MRAKVRVPTGFAPDGSSRARARPAICPCGLVRLSGGPVYKTWNPPCESPIWYQHAALRASVEGKARKKMILLCAIPVRPRVEMTERGITLTGTRGDGGSRLREDRRDGVHLTDMRDTRLDRVSCGGQDTGTRERLG